jgi:transposase
MRARHRLSKLLLRHGVRYQGKAWIERHRAWLATVELGEPAARATLSDYHGAIEVLLRRRAELEPQIEALIPDSPWQREVALLRCLRGIDTLSAVGPCAEIGDFRRFERAGQLMHYVGLVPSEATTGEQRRQGSITKTGSRHARRLVVEGVAPPLERRRAGWHYRHRPYLDKALAERQQGQPAPRSRSGGRRSGACTAPGARLRAKGKRPASWPSRRPENWPALLGDHDYRGLSFDDGTHD